MLSARCSPRREMAWLAVTWRGMMVVLGLAMAATVRGESLFYREGGLPAEHLGALGLSSHEYCSGCQVVTREIKHQMSLYSTKLIPDLLELAPLLEDKLADEKTNLALLNEYLSTEVCSKMESHPAFVGAVCNDLIPEYTTEIREAIERGANGAVNAVCHAALGACVNPEAEPDVDLPVKTKAREEDDERRRIRAEEQKAKAEERAAMNADESFAAKSEEVESRSEQLLLDRMAKTEERRSREEERQEEKKKKQAAIKADRLARKEKRRTDREERHAKLREQKDGEL